MSNTIASCNRCVKDIKYYNQELIELNIKLDELEQSTDITDREIKIKHQKNQIDETENALANVKRMLKDGIDSIEQDGTLTGPEKSQAIFDFRNYTFNPALFVETEKIQF